MLATPPHPTSRSKQKAPRSLTPKESAALLEELVKHKNIDPSRRTALRNQLVAILMLDAARRIIEVLQRITDDFPSEERSKS